MAEWFKIPVLKTGVRIPPSAFYLGVAQFGGALGLGPRGRRFESCHLEVSGFEPEIHFCDTLLKVPLRKAALWIPSSAG